MVQNSSYTTVFDNGTISIPEGSSTGRGVLSSVRQVEIICGACLQGLLTLLGLVGNSLIIAVMKRKAFKALPAQVYFIALACSDSVALLSWGTTHILVRGPRINIRRIRIINHIQQFLMDSSMSISAWYITYVAVERALIVLLPVRAKQISTPKNARRAVLTITVTMLIVMSPGLWMADWFSIKKEYLKAFQDFYAVKKTYVRIVYSYLPVLVTCFFYLLLLINIGVGKLKRTQKQNQSKSKIGSFSKSILVVFITYFVLTAPSTIVVLSNNFNPGWKTNLLFVTTVQELVSILRVLNYSSNFVIYWFTNSLFKKESIKLLSRKTRVNHLGSHSNSTNETRE